MRTLSLGKMIELYGILLASEIFSFLTKLNPRDSGLIIYFHSGWFHN